MEMVQLTTSSRGLASVGSDMNWLNGEYVRGLDFHFTKGEDIIESCTE